MKWIHLNLYFNMRNWDKVLAQDSNYHKYPKGKYLELIKYIQAIVENQKEYINRFFFLFEEEPHLFLALEYKEDKPDANTILNNIKNISCPLFIRISANITFGNDEDNGDRAIDLWYASAKFAFWRCSKEYRPLYLSCDENKVIHCFCNSNFVSWENESRFYMTGLLQRGITGWQVFLFIFRALYYQIIRVLNKLTRRFQCKQ